MQIESWQANYGRIVGLLVVTAFAVAVLFAGGSDILVLMRLFPAPEAVTAPVDPTIIAAPVSVQRVSSENIEILLTAAGRIQPFETYHPSFESAGRIVSLGDNGQGKPLDEGDRVEKGQILAVLDREVLLARHQEALARREQADDDLRRAQELQKRSPGSITATEYQRRITDVAVTKAAAAIAEKNLQDSTLYAPSHGVISRRYFQLGDSVSPHSTVFEILEDDRVLLVVGVPESHVEELALRRRKVDSNRQQAAAASERGQSLPFDEEELAFQAHVRLIGSDRFLVPRAEMKGVVHQLSENSEEQTRQFLVEILLDNRDGELRPGMIAIADIVVDRIQGFRLPVSTAQFRDGKTYLYSAKPVEAEVTFLGKPVGRGSKYQAQRFELSRYVEQGGDLIIPQEDLPEEHRMAIVRGQHRLVDGRLVRIVGPSSTDEKEPPQPRTVFAPAPGNN